MKKHLLRLLLVTLALMPGMAFMADAATKRILVVGNSFSFDASLQELLPIVQSAGDDIVLGFPYKGGTTLELHWKYITEEQQIYNYYKISGGKLTSTGGSSRCFDEAIIASEPWDVVVIQTDHNYSGAYDHYFPYLTDLKNYITGHLTNKDAKFYLYMTWAYQDGSPKMAELVKKGLYTDQADQYAKILDCARRAAVQSGIGEENVIPGGTAVQNGRTSYIGDGYNRDGYHMDLGHGRYTVALTWYEKIYGKSALDITYHPAAVSDFCAQMCRTAAHSAIATPWQVTSLEEQYGINPDAVHRPLDRPVLLNFGVGIGATATSQYAWNDLTSTVKGASVTALYNGKGYSTDLRVLVTAPFEGISNAGPTATDTPLDMPAKASSSSFYGSGASSLRISGLYPGQAYDMTVYVPESNSADAAYTFTGTAPVATTGQGNLLSATGVTADDSGCISLDITGNRFYIGALMITPHLQVPGKLAVNLNFTSDPASIDGW
ncbi:MAG: DUF4886 domain-containing protein, partial [Bacteroides sp.]|nr:DUF4886 domain-containing protein [Bacteroides sp.]